jgi:tRNA (cytidine/uridine-2'-O-)-methyltransferase
MFHIVLYQPEIPPNTGNIIRLCANAGSTLHLIHPLGFDLEDSKLRRAGLDYHELTVIREHRDYAAFLETARPQRLFAVTTRGAASYHEVAYQPGDALLLGQETRGLPQALLETFPPERSIRIPMVPGNRSINLSNAAAVVLYEAWRQQGFAGGG